MTISTKESSDIGSDDDELRTKTAAKLRPSFERYFLQNVQKGLKELKNEICKLSEKLKFSTASLRVTESDL